MLLVLYEYNQTLQAAADSSQLKSKNLSYNKIQSFNSLTCFNFLPNCWNKPIMSTSMYESNSQILEHAKATSWNRDLRARSIQERYFSNWRAFWHLHPDTKIGLRCFSLLLKIRSGVHTIEILNFNGLRFTRIKTWLPRYIEVYNYPQSTIMLSQFPKPHPKATSFYPSTNKKHIVGYESLQPSLFKLVCSHRRLVVRCVTCSI